MVSQKRKFGDFGESIAVKFLMKRGFSVVERNYLKPWGEIDIIVKKARNYHFIEVKTSELTGDVIRETNIRPEDNLHPKKLERMHKAVRTYCIEKGIPEEDISIDAVIVRINSDKNKAKVVFMENIVL